LPHRCQHEPIEPPRDEDAIMDGKGHVVRYHIRCRKCQIIIDTRKAEPS
jgi:hypothetical protein